MTPKDHMKQNNSLTESAAPMSAKGAHTDARGRSGEPPRTKSMTPVGGKGARSL